MEEVFVKVATRAELEEERDGNKNEAILPLSIL